MRSAVSFDNTHEEDRVQVPQSDGRLFFVHRCDVFLDIHHIRKWFPRNAEYTCLDSNRFYDIKLLLLHT